MRDSLEEAGAALLQVECMARSRTMGVWACGAQAGPLDFDIRLRRGCRGHVHGTPGRLEVAPW